MRDVSTLVFFAASFSAICSERCPAADPVLSRFHTHIIRFYHGEAPGTKDELASDAKLILAAEAKQQLDCPPAIAQAALWMICYILELIREGSQGTSKTFFDRSFKEVQALESRFQEVMTNVQDAEIDEWPIKLGREYAIEYSQHFNFHVSEAANAWRESMHGEEKITDEEYHAILKDAGKVLDALGLDWWPCRGTLISLLRHGARTGILSMGHIDRFDDDVDLMVGFESEQHSEAVFANIVDGLRDEGWHDCYGKRSVKEHWARTDLLYCRRTPSGPLVLDITSYIKGVASLDVVIHRKCFGDSKEYCEIPNGVGPMANNNGRLRKSAIYPLGRCHAAGLSVPCPHRPIQTLKAMKGYNFTRSCLPFPTAAGRHDDDPVSAWLSLEGLNAEDVYLLYKKAEELHSAGFKSMKPYFWSCRSLQQVY